MFGLLLLIGLGWLILRQILRATDPDRRVSRRSPPAQFQKTVRCARCGVHLPMTLARRDGDGYVCADPDCDHRQHAGQRTADRKR